MKCFHIRIYGKIHNLGFRFYTMQAAVQRRVNGYVKNASGGSIFIEAEGEDADIKSFIDWCQRGPFFTRVENVTIEEVSVKQHDSFDIR